MKATRSATPEPTRDASGTLHDWLTLLHTPGMGPRRIARLLEHFETPAAALQADSREWQRLGLPGGPARGEALQIVERGIEADLAWLNADSGHTLLTRSDPGYPPLLDQIPDPPAALYLVGDPALLPHPQIALVGSRDASPQGLRHAERFAASLAAAGLAITSGLALGIDGAAHHGALSVPGGQTLAVVATGPDRVYPRQHRRLAHRIVDQGGLLVSLWPVGTAAQPGHFPQRNRVISGLALGTLVVEAALRSGSLITARLAADQGRAVYAIPGSILSPVSRGCHQLIREGAQLIESPDEILEDLADWLGVAAAAPALPTSASGNDCLDPEQGQVLAAMGFDPVGLDDLLRRTGLTVDTLSSILVLLELNGRVAALSHGRYQRLDAGPP